MLGSICIIEFINTKQIARIRKFNNNDKRKKRRRKKRNRKKRTKKKRKKHKSITVIN